VASELTLSLMMGVGLDPVPRAVMEALTEVSVSIGAGGTSPSGFDLKFATSKLSQITTQLLPSGYFDPPTRVVIAATLSGSTTVLMDGVITQQDVVPSDESGKSVLSIKGEDLTRMMDLKDFGSLIAYPSMAAEARVAQMVAKYSHTYGITPHIIPAVLLDVPHRNATIPQQSGTDLAYINTLAERVGYTFYLQPGPTPGISTAYWGPKLQTFPSLPTPPPLAIDWDGRSNVESLQFSFDGFKKTHFVASTQVPDVQDPLKLRIPIPDVKELSPPLGQKDPKLLKVTPLVGLSGYNRTEARVIALAKAADSGNMISGQGTLDVLRYGAILPARTVVQVQGAGITYDGKYYVSTVTHTIKPGSYKQTFTLQRNRLIDGKAPDPARYGLGQQLPALSSAAAGSPPALPGPGPPLPVAAPGGPAVPAFGGASTVTSLPASPPS